VCIHVVYVICVIFRKHTWYTVNRIQVLVCMENYLDLRVSSVACICSLNSTIITQDVIQGISNVCAYVCLCLCVSVSLCLCGGCQILCVYVVYCVYIYD